ncbi:MAG: DUF362 domain-containing protein [Promethearchaeia archaeon]
MSKSQVLFTDRKATSDYNMLDKLEQIYRFLGLDDVIEDGSKVMVKTHFGQYGNTNYIRPAYVRKVVELVQESGGIPFVAETCGLGYGTAGIYGGRTTAVEYLGMALKNGYSPATVGAPMIMADGYWGTDVHTVEIDGEFVKEVDVAAALFDTDIVIMLTHAKGHGLSGIGGSLKNLGIGLVGKRGKAAMHHMGEVSIDPEKCLGPECGECIEVCPPRCITMDGETAVIDTAKCISCGHCRSVCSNVVEAKAVKIKWRPNPEQCPRFVENALGVVDSIGRDRFYYINLGIDISDKCDCWNVGAPLLVHDIGIFGSKDPVAVDQATVDAINDAEPNPESDAADLECGEPKFAHVHECKDDDTGELLHLADIQLSHAEKMGLGSREYELETLEKPESED